MDDINQIHHELFGSDLENTISGDNELEVSAQHNEIPQASGPVIEEVEASTHQNEKAPDNSFMIGPQKDTLYPDIDTLFAFYQEHARLRGFAAVRRSVTNNKYVVLACHSGGKSDDTKNTKKKGCKARVNAIKQDDGSWMISSVIS